RIPLTGAVVAGVAAGVVADDAHPPAAAAATHQAAQQRAADPRRTQGVGQGTVLRQPLLVDQEPLPADVRRQAPRQQDLPLVHRLTDAARVGAPGDLAARVELAAAPRVGAGVERVVQDVVDRRGGRGAPLDLALIRPGVGAERETNAV